MAFPCPIRDNGNILQLSTFFLCLSIRIGIPWDDYIKIGEVVICYFKREAVQKGGIEFFMNWGCVVVSPHVAASNENVQLYFVNISHSFSPFTASYSVHERFLKAAKCYEFGDTFESKLYKSDF